MTKDTMAKVMENPNYWLELLEEIKKTPALGPVFDLVIAKGLNK